jgi:murein L,D-transpeptidase YcbB/YkuD
VVAAVSQDPRPSVHADLVRLTAEAAQRYAAIAANGGWQPLPANATLSPGQRSPLMPILRYRLAAEGDLVGGDPGSDLYDPGVTAAVRRFQGRHGLKQTGAVGPATLKAMNVSAADRTRQLSATLERLASTELPSASRYVAVNIPSATVEAVEGGRVERRYVAVVGDPDHPSPTVEARIGAVNFNPTWTVPTSIIRNEIIPKMRKDPGYLAKNNIRILDPAGAEIDPAHVDWSTEKAVNFTLRQDPGVNNSLGIVRIAMPNRYSVYMHDTPSKGHFNRDMRFLSHGCVRVADVLDLVTWLLEPAGWSRPQVDMAVASKERLDIRLAQPVPVVWVYMTGYATGDGMVHFRDDVYGRDGLAAPVAEAGRVAER